MLNANLKQCTFKSWWLQPRTKQFLPISGPHRKWSDETMQKPITAVEQGVSLCQAAEMFDIP